MRQLLAMQSGNVFHRPIEPQRELTEQRSWQTKRYTSLVYEKMHELYVNREAVSCMRARTCVCVCVREKEKIQRANYAAGFVILESDSG